MSQPAIDIPEYKTPPPTGQSALPWLLYFLSPHKVTLWFYAILFLIRKSFYHGQPLFLGIMVGLVESGKAQQDPFSLVFWIALFAGIHIVVNCSVFIIIGFNNTLDVISKQISLYGLRHYLNLSEDWHENRASGEKLQRLLSARQYSYNFLEESYWRGLDFPAVLISVSITIFSLNAPPLYILLFALYVLSYLIASLIAGNWLFSKFKTYNQSLENVIGGVYEFILSTATIKFFNLRQHVLHKGSVLEASNHKDRRVVHLTSWTRWFVVNATAITFLTTIIAWSSYDVYHGNISVAAYSAIIFLSVSLWGSIEMFAIAHAHLIEFWEGLKRLTSVLNDTPNVIERTHAKDLVLENSSISFENVAFRYQDNAPLINTLNLNIAAGEKIGLLGSSGAGKSTLVKLLMRFYDVDEGNILLGEQDIRDVTQSSIYRNIAVIPQDIVLFNHPLIENIRYGHMDASDEDIYEAAQQANAHDFISDLPNGYQTLVGERGVKLSGGQRQRIAIARAILKNAPILILDEATSALDSESEKLIQESFKTLMQDKTVIAIAHRLSTIAHLDRLIVMDQGRIVEEGTHDELLSQKGLYAKLWTMQSGGFLGE